jgi:hypothetical protein
MGKYKYKCVLMDIKIAWILMFFQNVMPKLVQDMEYIKNNFDDLLIPTNSSFKDHLIKLAVLLARLSTAVTRLNISKSNT